MVNKEIFLEELKQIEVDILLNIDRFCKDNQLRYSIGYGTLIGAVRHHGFIPWDDDIDIMMPRPDYDKFIDTYHDPILKVLCIEHGNYYKTFAKVYDSRTIISNTNNKNMGIYVDIIPIDGLPSEEDSARRYLKKMVTMRKWLQRNIDINVMQHKKPFIQTLVLRILGQIWPVSKGIKSFLHNSKKYPFDSSEYAAGFAVGNETWLFKREDISEITEMSFEGHIVKAPINYDHCLRAVYGDYMKLPPEEERKPKHAYHVYWK